MVYEWPEHKDLCYKMYIEERKPLEDIMQHMRDNFNFTPSKRAYQTQFKRWDFPSKQNPAHRNPEIVSRVQELWNNNYSQQDMLKTLKDEGYNVKERELMRLRARHRWLLRTPNGQKQYSIDTDALTPLQNEILEQAGVPTEVLQRSKDTEEVPELSENIDEILRKRKQRHDQMQAESDERYATKKRRRRTRDYAGIPADPPGPPRFPSETTIHESKQILSLSKPLYQALRAQFQSICEEEDVIKKTLAGTEKWQLVKDRLVRENEHLQATFYNDKATVHSKGLALDVIATDVTKRMRGIGDRMTVVVAKNSLGLNPEQSRQVRDTFYLTLKADKFTSKLETGPEHWQELKDQWLHRTPLLNRLFTEGEADPEYDQKQKAVEALCRDVMKRLRDDQSKRTKNRKKATGRKPATTQAGPVATAAAATALAAAQNPPAPEQSAYQFSQDLADLQIDPTLLEAASARNFAAPATTETAVYIRPHANSQVHKNEKMWLAQLSAHTVQELRNMLARKWPNAAVARIDGIEKGANNGQDLAYLIEEDDELDAYLDHIKGRTALFVVQLNRP